MSTCIPFTNIPFIKVPLSGGTREQYYTGSQSADSYLLLRLFCDKATTLQATIQEAKTRLFPDLCEEMGLCVYEPTNKGSRSSKRRKTSTSMEQSTVRALYISFLLTMLVDDFIVGRSCAELSPRGQRSAFITHCRIIHTSLSFV